MEANAQTFSVTNLDNEIAYTFTIVTFDSDGNASSGVRISTIPFLPPVIDPNPVIVLPGEIGTVEVRASNPNEGETLTLSLDGTKPEFVTIVDHRDGNATITINNNLGTLDAGSYNIPVIETSGSKNVANELIIIIPINITPNPVTVSAGETKTVRITRFSLPGDPLPTLQIFYEEDPPPPLSLITISGINPATITIDNTAGNITPNTYNFNPRISFGSRTVNVELAIIIPAID